ncbi:MAG TPA: type II toxin-antitoxin system VapC family toxin [Polyangia bacterium]|nr:type II toxin-antitoxin system VapC family toxin [Polyangia bacterium]
MLFDTDVLIYAQRGSRRAALAIDNAARRLVSVQSAMELVQGARDKDDLRTIKRFLAELGFTVLPLTEDIGHRSLVYVEEYGLSAGLRAGDAIIAATAVENALPLMSANAKHFRPINELELVVFRP